MSPNREITLLLLFSVLCSCLLAVIFSDLLKTRKQLANNSPIAFNSLLQISRNFSGLEHSLSQYVHNNDEPVQTSIDEYRTRFDIAWSTLAVFELRVPGETTTMPEVPEFLNLTENFFNNAEPQIHADTPLSPENAINLRNLIFEVRERIYDLGHAYYISSNKWRDTLNNRMTKLYRAISVFGLLLLASSSFLICRLYFANRKSYTLVEESRQNQKELKRLVSELRSGKLEQKAKDSFIAAASHDLRQPLHALGLFLGSLEKYVQPDGLPTLEKANQSSTALNRLLSSVLDLSKLDAGIVSVDATHFGIDALIVSLIKEHSAKAEQYDIELHFDLAHATVYTDRVLLTRILRNLLDNAMKHSNGSSVALRVQTKQPHLLLTIEDDGDGIPETEHKEIFSEYYQIGNPERDRSYGLGLGLSIVKRLTDLLDMPLKFSSIEGKGSCFSLMIPLSEANTVTELSQDIDHRHSQSQASQYRLSGHHRRHRTIAVIDDQQDICLGMESVLKSYNFHVVSAESASGMIHLLEQQDLHPDAIVSDYRLRNNELGDQAVKDIRVALGRETPALLVTGDTSPKRVLEASRSGCTLLHKPVTPDHLVQALDQLFAEKQFAAASI